MFIDGAIKARLKLDRLLNSQRLMSRHKIAALLLSLVRIFNQGTIEARHVLSLDLPASRLRWLPSCTIRSQKALISDAESGLTFHLTSSSLLN